MEGPIRKTKKDECQNPPFPSAPVNEQGFTYIELVLSFFVLVLLLPALFFAVHTLEKELKKMMGQERLQMEYLAFHAWVQDELRQGSRFRLQGGAMLFDLPTGETVRYEVKKRQVIRSVKAKGETTFKGMTIILRHVYFIAFVPGKKEVVIDVGLQNWHASLDFSVTVAERTEVDDGAR
ncbi:hypothetical protein [Lihuaxuella thermophila]|uniref:Competence protein ComGF n=1 Tax=Lihuaxuella thermophila TaxID=1173111 RepID=A0A1H8DIC3_9BACL|nr:hypothetical protein [Lihuaxuella thermophila]SEN06514.1 hypothetical protein SAMN05444955_105177 [Lihuaxuella thermophila]